MNSVMTIGEEDCLSEDRTLKNGKVTKDIIITSDNNTL